MQKLGLRSKLRGIWPDMPPPISLWRFDGPGGDDPCPDAIGSNDLEGGESLLIVDGKVGKAIRLVAGTPSVTTNDFNFITDPFTVFGLFKRAAGTDTLTLAYAEAIAGRVWAVEIAATTVAMIADENGSSPTAFDTVTLPSDTWHFVCARFDAANIYINVNARTEVSTAALTLGDATGGTLTFSAPSGTVDLDHWGICDYCMTDSQVYAAYKRLMAGASIW